MKVWIARDKNNKLAAYTNKPHYDESFHMWCIRKGERFMQIDSDLFEDIQPGTCVEAEIILKDLEGKG